MQVVRESYLPGHHDVLERSPDTTRLERLTGQDLQMIEEFLMRRYHLANRRELAGHILRSLYERAGQPAESLPTEDPEGMLAALYHVLKNRTTR